MEGNMAPERYRKGYAAIFLILVTLVSVLTIGCKPRQEPIKNGDMALSVSSRAFQDGQGIPEKYTCQGRDISPPLAWSKPPTGTQSFALIMDDPDAPGGVFTHWVIFNIPPDRRELSEAVPIQAQLASGGLQGNTDFGKIGYGGPCPWPPGNPHRYQFTLYAVDKTLDLNAGATKQEVLDAMQGHILAQAQLTGTYQR
jgi:Raf kinase inhibitor-like YbhB/YbcL family protein